MIITDGIHVVSTVSLKELHEWAKRNGISRNIWFHGTRKGHPHYDLPGTRKFLLYTFSKEGAIVGEREVLEHAKRIYEQRLSH